MKSHLFSNSKWRALIAASLMITSFSSSAQAGILVAAFHPIGLLIAGGSILLSYPWIGGAMMGVLLDEKDPSGSLQAHLSQRFPQMSEGATAALAGHIADRAQASRGTQDPWIRLSAEELRTILGEAEVESLGTEAFANLVAALQ